MGVPLSLSGGGTPSGGTPDSVAGSGAGGSSGSPVRAAPLWRLVRVRGEARHPVLPTTPSPEFPPESVVEAQLRALQDYNFDKASWGLRHWIGL